MCSFIDRLYVVSQQRQKQKQQQQQQQHRSLLHDRRQTRLFERILLRAIFTNLDQPIQQGIFHLQKTYVRCLSVYFQAIDKTLLKNRTTTTAAARNEEQSSNVNFSSSSSSTTQIISMEYLRVIFNDTPEIVRFLHCFTSVENFEQSLVPFPEPMVRERGGIFKRLYPTFELSCDLDDKLLAVLTRFQKEDLYTVIVTKLHANIPMLKFILSIVLKAIEYHEEPHVIAHKIHEVWTDVYDLCLNVLYQWLISLKTRDIQTLFGGMLKKFAAFNEQLPQWVNQLRDDLLIVNNELNAAGSSSRSNIRSNNKLAAAKNSSKNDEHDDDDDDGDNEVDDDARENSERAPPIAKRRKVATVVAQPSNNRKKPSTQL